MARKSRRGLVSRLYRPLHHALVVGEEAVSAVTNTARNVVRTGIRGVDRVGTSLTGHTDAAIRNLVSRKSRRGRKSSGGSRKNRRSTRRNRSNRKSRRN